MSEIDVTRYRLTVRGDSGEMLELITGEVSTNAGKVTVPLTWRDTASIDIEWTRDEPHHADRSKWSGKHHPDCPVPGLDHDCAAVIAAWAQHNGHYGVRPGPDCTCVQASDTGHDSECPRAAFARGAEPHHKGHYGAPVTVDCPVPRCTATSQDLPAHMADYHPELHHSADYVASEACPNLIFPEHGAESPCVRCGFKK